MFTSNQPKERPRDNHQTSHYWAAQVTKRTARENSHLSQSHHRQPSTVPGNPYKHYSHKSHRTCVPSSPWQSYSFAFHPTQRSTQYPSALRKSSDSRCVRRYCNCNSSREHAFTKKRRVGISKILLVHLTPRSTRNEIGRELRKGYGHTHPGCRAKSGCRNRKRTTPQWQDPVCGISGMGSLDPSQRHTIVSPGLGLAPAVGVWAVESDILYFFQHERRTSVALCVDLWLLGAESGQMARHFCLPDFVFVSQDVCSVLKGGVCPSSKYSYRQEVVLVISEPCHTTA